MPFLINTLALFYNFGKSWKSDPGIIKASEEQKKKVKPVNFSGVYFTERLFLWTELSVCFDVLVYAGMRANVSLPLIITH